MRLKQFQSSDYRKTVWSGGETTQLLLLPEHAVYEVGQFDCRISSATITVDESTFTVLPGYDRIILSLDNPLALQHNGGVTVTLTPLAHHHFLGDDTTKSFGKCTDFNVIYKTGFAVEVRHIDDNVSLKLTKNAFIYALEPSTFSIKAQHIALNKNDSLYVDLERTGEVMFIGEQVNGIIVVLIEYSK